MCCPNRFTAMFPVSCVSITHSCLQLFVCLFCHVMLMRRHAHAIAIHCNICTQKRQHVPPKINMHDQMPIMQHITIPMTSSRPNPQWQRMQQIWHQYVRYVTKAYKPCPYEKQILILNHTCSMYPRAHMLTTLKLSTGSCAIAQADVGTSVGNRDLKLAFTRTWLHYIRIGKFSVDSPPLGVAQVDSFYHFSVAWTALCSVCERKMHCVCNSLMRASR